MLEREGTEESQGLGSQSESSDEEPDLLCLQPRTAGWMEEEGTEAERGQRVIWEAVAEREYISGRNLDRKGN